MAKNTAVAAATPKTETTVVNAEPIAPQAPIAPVEPTSEKLVELRAKRLEFKKLARTFEPDSPEEENALLEAYKVDQLIKAEIASIAQAEAKQKLDVARNERIALNTAQFVALFETEVAFNLFVASMPEEQAAKFAAAQEIVNNELLAKFATSKPATAKKSGDTPTSTDGATKGEIVALHVANVAAGMDDSASRKAIEALGHARSTVWHAVNNYNKSK